MTTVAEAKKWGYWRGWTEEQQKNVRELLMDRDLPYAEIARAFPVEGGVAAIKTYAGHVGAPERAKRAYTKRGDAPLAMPKNLSAVETQIEIVRRKQAELEAELKHLQDVKQEMSIRFERDGGDVLVYGVAPQPLRASIEQWVTFLNKEGARKLRDYIVATTKSTVV